MTNNMNGEKENDKREKSDTDDLNMETKDKGKESVSETTTNGTEPQTDENEKNTSKSFNAEARRRLKNEARLTSGIGKGKEKTHNLNVFWNEIWPKLEEAGWTKVNSKFWVDSLNVCGLLAVPIADIET